MKFVCFEGEFILNGFFAAIFNVLKQILSQTIIRAMSITLRQRKSKNKSEIWPKKISSRLSIFLSSETEMVYLA